MEQARAGELDQAIIERVRRGDTNAFGLIVQQYQTPVYNLAYRMLGDRNEAEDAAQETFLRAYGQLKRYRTDQKFATWLLSIAAHYCIDRLRRRKFQWLDIDESAQETLPAKDPGPEETALSHEREQEAQQLLQQLSPSARAIVVLKYWNDLGLDEIAQLTGDTVANVKVKLFRARQAMARALDAQRRDRGAAPRGLNKATAHVQ